MVIVNQSVSDRSNYLVVAGSIAEAERKVKARFPGTQIMGTYMLESEVIR